MKKVGIGHLGTTLDASNKTNARWNKWRPTVAACWQEDFQFDRYEIVYSKRFKGLLKQVVADINEVSPKTEIVLHEMELEDPWEPRDPQEHCEVSLLEE